MRQDVWLELFPGLLLAVGIIVIFKGGSGWYMFRRSIYKEIYSNYLEYVIRKKSLMKLSESYFLESRFQKHRIYYQIASVKGEKIPQAYVVLILESGMYLLNIKRQTGELEAFKDSVNEVRFFQKKLNQKLHGEVIPEFPIVVFPDNSTFRWKDKEKGMPVIHRKHVFQTVKGIHDKQDKMLSEEAVDRIYFALAGDALEAERGERKGFRKMGFSHD